MTTQQGVAAAAEATQDGLPADFVARVAAMRKAAGPTAFPDDMFRHIPRTSENEAIDWLWHAIASAPPPSLRAMTAAAGTSPDAFLDAADRIGYGPLFD